MQVNDSHRSQESGAVLSFVIGVIVLIGLLAGGLWFIKNRHDVAANAPTVASDTKKDAETSNNNAPQGGQPSENGTGSTQAPSSQPTQNGSSSQTPQSGGTASQPSSPTPQPSSVATTGPTHIATTGPEDVVINGFLLVSLIVVGYLYHESRRQSA